MLWHKYNQIPYSEGNTKFMVSQVLMKLKSHSYNSIAIIRINNKKE